MTPLSPDALSIDSLVEYMSACAQIARNGADIHRGSKEMRHRSDMLDAVTDRLRDSKELLGSVEAYLKLLKVSLNAGPSTNSPRREVQFLERMRNAAAVLRERS